jgi:hypothetical protein
MVAIFLDLPSGLELLENNVQQDAPPNGELAMLGP